MLKKINRFTQRKEFLEAKNKGKIFDSYLFGAVSLNDKTENLKFGFVISKKISKRAVDRNKIKRRLSEALRTRLNEFKPGTKIIFLAKKSLLEAKREEIEKEIIKLISNA